MRGGGQAIFAFSTAIPSVCEEDSEESYQEMTVVVDTAQITDSAARSSLPSVKAERGVLDVMGRREGKRKRWYWNSLFAGPPPALLRDIIPNWS